MQAQGQWVGVMVGFTLSRLNKEPTIVLSALLDLNLQGT